MVESNHSLFHFDILKKKKIQTLSYKYTIIVLITNFIIYEYINLRKFETP
jgi:hypothetical protein